MTYIPSLQARTCLGEACASLTNQNVTWCIFLLFSMLSSAFLLIDSCLFLLCRLFVPSCLEATLRRSSNGGAGSIPRPVQLLRRLALNTSWRLSLLRLLRRVSSVHWLRGGGILPIHYDVYRLTSLRVDGIVPTFSAFPIGVRPDREYLGVSLGATSADLPILMRAFVGLLRPLLKRQPRWLGLFCCT